MDTPAKSSPEEALIPHFEVDLLRWITDPMGIAELLLSDGVIPSQTVKVMKWTDEDGDVEQEVEFVESDGDDHRRLLQVVQRAVVHGPRPAEETIRQLLVALEATGVRPAYISLMKEFLDLWRKCDQVFDEARKASRGYEVLCRPISDGGNTILHVAVNQRREPLVKKVLALTEQMSAPAEDSVKNKRDSNGYTPLHIVAQLNYTGMAEALLQHGASTEIRDKRGCTPLHGAALCGSVDVLNLLCNVRYSDINMKDQYGCTPLYLAAAAGREACVRTLLSNGARDDIEDYEWKTPLQVAQRNLAGELDPEAKQPHEKIVELLSSPEKMASLVLAEVKRKFEEVREELSLASPSQAEERLQEHMGDKILLLNNVLHVAVEHGQKELVDEVLQFMTKLPLKGKSYADVEDTYGITPLHIAAKKNYVVIARVLLQHGASVEIKAKDEGGRTPVHMAAWYGSPGVLSLLYNQPGYDAILKMTSDMGRFTPLVLAAINGKEACVRLLLIQGASVDKKDNGGGDPLEEAKEGMATRSGPENKHHYEKIIDLLSSPEKIAALVATEGAKDVHSKREITPQAEEEVEQTNPTPRPSRWCLDSLPEGKLDTTHLRLLVDCLKKLTDWKTLGLHLEIAYWQLEGIEADRHTLAERKMSMLNDWLCTGDANKQTLCLALEKMD